MADEFKVHRLNGEGLAQADHLAEVFGTALGMVQMILKRVPSREYSLVVTKMQEASYWAKRAMAMQPGNQVGSNPHRMVLNGDGTDHTHCANCGIEESDPATRGSSCPINTVGSGG
jgi:hypothetical protein